MANKKPTKAIVKAQAERQLLKKLMLSTSFLKSQQILYILQKTPSEYIYTRKAKGGGEWEFVPAAYIKKVLNYAFGWLWDFEIKDKGREGDLVWVQGRLTIRDKKGNALITKEQFGRSDIKYYRDKSKGILDYGNDLKSAATDALKKCASELGIASDIYGKNEFREIRKIDKSFKMEEENTLEMTPTTPIVKPKVENTENNTKLIELKKELKGKTDKEKLVDLKKRTGIDLQNFNVTERHASVLFASLLNSEINLKIKKNG